MQTAQRSATFSIGTTQTCGTFLRLSETDQIENTQIRAASFERLFLYPPWPLKSTHF